MCRSCGWLVEETLAARTGEANERAFEKSPLMPPKTSFPFAIRDDYLRAQRDAARNSGAHRSLCLRVWPRCVARVDVHGIVLGVIELERLPGGGVISI